MLRITSRFLKFCLTFPPVRSAVRCRKTHLALVPWLFSWTKSAAHIEAPQSYLVDAEICYNDGHFEDAIAIIENRKDSEKAGSEILCLLSYYYWKWAMSGDYDENYSDYTRRVEKSHELAAEAFQLDPESAKANKMMGLSLLAMNYTFIEKLKNGASIVHYLERSVELDDTDWEVHHYLGSQYVAAIEQFRGPIMIFLEVFVFGIPRKSIDEALIHLLRAEELAPCQSCANLAKLAVIYYKSNDYIKSKFFIEKAVNFNCRNSQDEREKEDAAKVLLSWASFTNFYKTVEIS